MGHLAVPALRAADAGTMDGHSLEKAQYQCKHGLNIQSPSGRQVLGAVCISPHWMYEILLETADHT